MKFSEHHFVHNFNYFHINLPLFFYYTVVTVVIKLCESDSRFLTIEKIIYSVLEGKRTKKHLEF